MNSSTSHISKQLNPVLRWVLLFVGFVAVILGIVGIFLPVLPTVPFLLLASGCFARSSERFYVWLLDHAQLGPLLRPYLQGSGIPPATKLKAIALIWFSIIISVFFFHKTIWMQVGLLTIAVGVTLYLWYLPTAETVSCNKVDS
ncbi:MAG: YbaN family protein [Desulfuromonadales bacterium]|nr:YbaN family protein [Desulfuromonadales bacterium]